MNNARNRIMVSSLMAIASAAWSADPLPVGTGTGLFANYYMNQTHEFGDASGVVTVKRTDATVDFDWGNGSPDPKIPSDFFTTVWNGYLLPQVTGTHTIYISGAGGRRVWVNGVAVVNQWANSSVAYSGTVDLVAGQQVAIRVDYFEATGAANVKLEWEAAGLTRAVIPTTQLFPEDLPTGAVGTGTGLLAGYFPGSGFSGTPVLRTDKTIAFKWPSAPIVGFPSENFCVRWQGKITPKLGEATTLILSTDDGARMWLDGVQVVDDWTSHPTKEYRIALPIGAGVAHDVRIDYFEGGAPGEAKLEWEGQHTPRMAVPVTQLAPASGLLTPAATNGAGLSGSYFANSTLSGNLLVRRDRTVDFNWGSGAPAGGIPIDHFSVRWSGKIQTRYDETYTLMATADDGIRVWLDGVQVINDWINTGAKLRSYPFVAAAGRKYDLRIEYYDYTGAASARLEWSSPSESRQVVPEACLYPNDLDVAVPAASAVSPAFIEGVHGTGLTVSTTAGTVTGLGSSGFFVNEPLSPTAATAISLTAGAGTASGTTVWTPTVLNADANLVVRPGDSLLFKAAVTGTWNIGLNCGTFKASAPINAGDTAAVRFDVPGFYQVCAFDSLGVAVAAVSVNVPNVLTSGGVPVAVEYARNKDVSFSNAGDIAAVTWTAADQWVAIGTGTLPAGSPATSKRLTVKATLNRPSCAVGRVNGVNGPILSALPVLPFVISSDAEIRIKTIAIYPDFSSLCEANLFMTPLIKGLTVKMKSIVAGVTFDDSTTSRLVTTDVFKTIPIDIGDYTYRVIRAPGLKTGVCHTWQFFDQADAVSP